MCLQPRFCFQSQDPDEIHQVSCKDPVDTWYTGVGSSLLGIRGGTLSKSRQKNDLHLKPKCNQTGGTESLQVLGHCLDPEQEKY